MKLYATITALKLEEGKHIAVKKSQGSNTQINIEINIDSEKPRFRLHINKRDDTTYLVLVDLKKPYPNQVFQQKIEGEKQKGEKYCTSCGFVEAQNGDYCTKCGVKMIYKI